MEGPRVDAPLLEVTGLSKSYGSGGLFSRGRRTLVLQDIAFRIGRGEVVALVGESGSGKSTFARLLVRLESPDRGALLLEGIDQLIQEPRRASLRFRSRVQMVFQDPFGSLNPAHNVGHHLERPLLRHGRVKAGAARAGALKLLASVGLQPPESFIDRRPDELSGGQRQRVAIARALAVEPELLIADEPTSMLDVSMRMGILNLLAQLKRERGLSILLITHDLASARFLADRILVLYRGRIVEEGTPEQVVENPAHPYSRALVASIPDPEGDLGSRFGLPAEDTDRDATSSGCAYAPRCHEVMEICKTREPAFLESNGRHVRCHLFHQGNDHL